MELILCAIFIFTYSCNYPCHEQGNKGSDVSHNMNSLMVHLFLIALLYRCCCKDPIRNVCMAQRLLYLEIVGYIWLSLECH